MKGLAIIPSQKQQIKNIFRLLGFNDDIIDIIISLKINKEMKETMYFQKNCLIHKTLHFNLLNKIITKYDCEKELYNDYYRFCIPVQKDIEWCINVDEEKGDLVVRNNMLNMIEMIGQGGFIKKFCNHRFVESTLKEKINIFKKKSYEFVNMSYTEFIEYGCSIIIDPSGQILYYD